ncbi:MAG: ABC transporter substrate-binding protein [Anaerolineae bacterium]
MKKISRRQFLRVSAVAGAGAVLAACGPQEAPTEAPTEEPVEPEAPEATEAPEPTAVPVEERVWPREDVPRERTLSYSYPAGSEFGNVGIAVPYAAGYTHQHGDAVSLEPMFYYAALNDKTWPWLAESYEYNDDATECTVFLRKGAMWSDGEPLTAEDIAFTYNTLIERAPDYDMSAEIKNNVQEAQVIDDTTVKFILTEPNYRFHFNYCTFRFDRHVYIVPKHIFEGIEDWRENTMFDVEAGLPVVSGPYQLVRFEPQVKWFDLRYEWWAYDIGLVDRMPYPERLQNQPYNEEVTTQQMINDEVDHALDMRPATIEAILAQAPDHIITYTGQEKPYGYVDWWPISMYFNTLEPPYDNPDVRWAMAYAIDQQVLVDVAWDGAGTVTGGPFPHYPGITQYFHNVPQVVEGYDPLEVNLDKVEELMTGAGYSKNEDGWWADENGESLPVDIYAAVPLFADIAPVTAELLRQAGFEANHLAPPDVWDIKSQTALLHFFGHGGSVADPYVTMSFYHSQWQTPTGENCGNNRPRWANEEYDAIVEEMSRTPMDDKEKMQELFTQGMEIWFRELPEVPLVQWYHRLALNTTYWTNWPTEDNPYNTALWHCTALLTMINLEMA